MQTNHIEDNRLPANQSAYSRQKPSFPAGKTKRRTQLGKDGESPGQQYIHETSKRRGFASEFCRTSIRSGVAGAARAASPIVAVRLAPLAPPPSAHCLASSPHLLSVSHRTTLCLFLLSLLHPPRRHTVSSPFSALPVVPPVRVW